MKLYQHKMALLRFLRTTRALFDSKSDYEPRNIQLEVLNRLLLEHSTGATTNHFDGERPIFLLATGWRSGSTLVQRILSSNQSILLWGEPYGQFGITQSLTESLSLLGNYPMGSDEAFRKPDKLNLQASWIANLYPTVGDLRFALQSFFCSWFKEPAKNSGFDCWGFKEVRLDYHDAAFLHWLFPAAKFVCVTRNPLDSYRSALGLGELWDRLPDRLIDNPLSFARLWNRIVSSWELAPESFPVHHLKYEDLLESHVVLEGLREFLNVELSPKSALNKKIGSTSPDVELGILDELVIRRLCSPAMSRLGYF